MIARAGATRSPARLPIAIGLAALGFLGLTAAIHATVVPAHDYSNRDFMSLYAGGRAVLMGLDPYDPAVWPSLRGQLGSTWMPDARSPFPLWTLLMVAPFSLLDLGWAVSAWLAFSLLALGFGLILFVRSFRASRPLSLAEFVLLAASAFTFRATLLSVYHGQLTLLILLFLVLFVVLERAQRPFLAGIMLAAVALKPNAFVLFVPLLGLWLLLKKRWSIIAGAAAGGAAMLVASWMVQPGWIDDWMNVRGKLEATWLTPTVWGLASELAGPGWPTLGAIFVLIAVVGIAWLLFTRSHLTVAQATCLALIGSLLVTPYTWTYEHVFLLIPATLLYLTMPRRLEAVSVWVILTVLLPWGALWLAYRRSLDTLSVLIPLCFGLAFWYFGIRRAEGRAGLRAEGHAQIT